MQSGQPGHPGSWPGVAYGHPGFPPYPGTPMPPERELEWLKNQTQFLNQQIEYIAARIKELEEK
jgi:hypothetical protein